MKVSGIVKTRNIDKNNKRLEIYTPKYKNGRPIALLSFKYDGQPIELITSWTDLPIKLPLDYGYGVICVNGSAIENNIVGKQEIARGSVITCFGDNTVYIVVAESMIK